MAVNQPPITGNEILDSWLLEVTRELNSGQRFEAFATDIPRPGGGGTLMQTDYTLTIPTVAEPGLPPTAYEFTMVNGDIPDAHMVFLGGMRLCEDTDRTMRDYSISGNVVTLNRSSRDLGGLDLVLTIFS